MDEHVTLPHVTVVIVTWNGRQFLPACLSSVAALTYPSYSVIVVDNGSTDGTDVYMREHFSSVEYIRLEQNTGFCHANNVGIMAATGEYVALLNNDTTVDAEWLSALVKGISARPEYAFASSCMRQMRAPEVLDRVADAFSSAGFMWALGAEESVDTYTTSCDIFGACAGAALYRLSALEEVGLLDERFFAYVEDIDLSWRLHHAGHSGVYVPDAHVWHYGGGTSQGQTNPWVARQTVRNVWLTLFKNIPLWVWIKMAPRICVYHVYWMLRFRCIRAYVCGWFSFILQVPGAYASRRKILRSSRLNARDIWRIMSEEDRKIFCHIRRRARAEGRGEPRALWRWLFLHGAPLADEI